MGRVEIAPQFQAANPFVDGLAAVQDRDGLWDFVDEGGKIAVHIRSRLMPRDFSGGLLAVSQPGPQGTKWGYLGKDGRYAILPQFDSASDFHEGLAAVEVNGKWIYIDRLGQRAFPGDFERAGPFQEGLACTRAEGLYGFIDRTGRFAVTPQFADAEGFSDGLAAVADSKIQAKWGYVDRLGKIAIPHQFAKAGPFSEGLAAVQALGTASFETWGYIDRTGGFAFSERFREAHRFSHRLAAVVRKETWNVFGYIDRSGNVRIPARFQNAGEFNADGVARVSLDTRVGVHPGGSDGTTWTGYIDRAGRVIWNSQR